jgi:copper chaperone CopZ
MTGFAFACPPDGDGAKSDAKVEKSENGGMTEVQFANLDLSVKGMTCAGCENKVKAALISIDGVVEAKKVCAQSNSASLTYDASVVSEEQIMAALKEKTGYAIAIVKNAGMTEADAHKCSAECKKDCCAGKTSKAASCEKSKATGAKDLEKE